jgi:hypothetical protein
MKSFLLIVIGVIVFSCSNKGNINSHKDELKYEKDVMQNIDPNSYLHLLNYFDKPDNYQNLLPYSLKLMKLQEDGYCDFFITYQKICNNNRINDKSILNLDKEEQQFLIYLLNKGALNGDASCKDILIYYYINGIVVSKNLNKADSIFQTFQYPKQKFEPQKFDINKYFN